MAKPKYSTEDEEYELLPHHELQELKEELRRLKEFEITPSKKMHVTMIELNHKLDKLITIFEDAMHEVRVEEGGLKFADKMRPVVSKMNKILEQNSEIASGILAVVDMLKEEKGSQRFGEPKKELPPLPGEELPPLPGQNMQPPSAPTPPPRQTGPPRMPTQPPGPKPTGPPRTGAMPPPPPPEPSPKPTGPPPPRSQPLPPPKRRSFGL